MRRLGCTDGEGVASGADGRGGAAEVQFREGRQAEVRLYDRLFTHEAPDRGDNDYLDFINPASLAIVEQAWIEPSLASATPKGHETLMRDCGFYRETWELQKQEESDVQEGSA